MPTSRSAQRTPAHRSKEALCHSRKVCPRDSAPVHDVPGVEAILAWCRRVGKSQSRSLNHHAGLEAPPRIQSKIPPSDHGVPKPNPMEQMLRRRSEAVLNEALFGLHFGVVALGSRGHSFSRIKASPKPRAQVQIAGRTWPQPCLLMTILGPSGSFSAQTAQGTRIP